MEWVILNVAVVALAVGGAVGWAIGRWAGGRPVFWLVVAGLLAAAAMLLMAQQGSAYDGIGYVIGAVVLVAPAALGAALGGWIGARQRRG